MENVITRNGVEISRATDPLLWQIAKLAEDEHMDQQRAESISGKSIRIKMTYRETGKVYHWTIRRVPRAYASMTFKGKFVQGWQFTDHEGYTRFSEGNWFDLVDHFRRTADGYGMNCNIS